MPASLIRTALACLFLLQAGCIHYPADSRHREQHGYESDRCYDTEYGRRCRPGQENEQGEDEQN